RALPTVAHEFGHRRDLSLGTLHCRGGINHVRRPTAAGAHPRPGLGLRHGHRRAGAGPGPRAGCPPRLGRQLPWHSGGDPTVPADPPADRAGIAGDRAGHAPRSWGECGAARRARCAAPRPAAAAPGPGEHGGDMIRSMYQAAAAMMAEFSRQLTISENLANVSTPGYKARRTTVQDFREMFLSRFAGGSATPIGSI